MNLENMPDINLLPADKRHGSKAYGLFVFLMIVAFIGYVTIGVLYLTENKELQLLDEEYQAVKEGADAVQLEMTRLENKDNALEQAVQFAEQNTLPASELITALTDELKTYNYMDDYENNMDEVTFTNQFETLNEVAAYMTALNETEFITDTIVEYVDTFTLKDHQEEDNNTEDFLTIPRYTATFQIQVDKQALKGALAEE